MDTKIYISFTEYLEKELKGAVINDIELDRYRKAYRKEYMKEYYRNRRSTTEHRLTIRLTKRDYNIIKQYAEAHAMSMSSFVGQSVLAYCEKGYVPRDKSSISDLSKMIVRIANNINQLVKRYHVKEKYSQEYDRKKLYNQIVLQVLDLRSELIMYMNKPPLNLKQALIEFLEQNSLEKRKDLAEFILNS